MTALEVILIAPFMLAGAVLAQLGRLLFSRYPWAIKAREELGLWW